MADQTQNEDQETMADQTQNEDQETMADQTQNEDGFPGETRVPESHPNLRLLWLSMFNSRIMKRLQYRRLDFMTCCNEFEDLIPLLSIQTSALILVALAKLYNIQCDRRAAEANAIRRMASAFSVTQDEDNFTLRWRTESGGVLAMELDKILIDVASDSESDHGKFQADTQNITLQDHIPEDRYIVDLPDMLDPVPEEECNIVMAWSNKNEDNLGPGARLDGEDVGGSPGQPSTPFLERSPILTTIVEGQPSSPFVNPDNHAPAESERFDDITEGLGDIADVPNLSDGKLHQVPPIKYGHMENPGSSLKDWSLEEGNKESSQNPAGVQGNQSIPRQIQWEWDTQIPAEQYKEQITNQNVIRRILRTRKRPPRYAKRTMYIPSLGTMAPPLMKLPRLEDIIKETTQRTQQEGEVLHDELALPPRPSSTSHPQESEVTLKEPNEGFPEEILSSEACPGGLSLTSKPHTSDNLGPGARVDGADVGGSPGQQSTPFLERPARLTTIVEGQPSSPFVNPDNYAPAEPERVDDITEGLGEIADVPNLSYGKLHQGPPLKYGPMENPGSSLTERSLEEGNKESSQNPASGQDNQSIPRRIRLDTVSKLRGNFTKLRGRHIRKPPRHGKLNIFGPLLSGMNPALMQLTDPRFENIIKERAGRIRREGEVLQDEVAMPHRPSSTSQPQESNRDGDQFKRKRSRPVNMSNDVLKRMLIDTVDILRGRMKAQKSATRIIYDPSLGGIAPELTQLTEPQCENMAQLAGEVSQEEEEEYNEANKAFRENILFSEAYSPRSPPTSQPQAPIQDSRTQSQESISPEKLILDLIQALILALLTGEKLNLNQLLKSKLPSDPTLVLRSDISNDINNSLARVAARIFYYICDLASKDKVVVQQVSQGETPGDIWISQKEKTTHIGMFAWGFGITHVYEAIQDILPPGGVVVEDEKPNVRLIYAHDPIQPVLLKEQLDLITHEYPGHFKTDYLANENSSVWCPNGIGGMLAECIVTNFPAPGPNTKIFTCSPPHIDVLMANHLGTIGYREDMRHQIEWIDFSSTDGTVVEKVSQCQTTDLGTRDTTNMQHQIDWTDLSPPDEIAVEKVSQDSWISEKGYRKTKRIGMFAWGSGISQIYQVIRDIFTRGYGLAEESEVPWVRLIYAHDHPVGRANPPYADDIETLANFFLNEDSYEYYLVTDYLSKEDSSVWGPNGIGEVLSGSIASEFPPPGPDTKILICCPPDIYEALSNHLGARGYTPDMLHQIQWID